MRYPWTAGALGRRLPLMFKRWLICSLIILATPSTAARADEMFPLGEAELGLIAARVVALDGDTLLIRERITGELEYNPPFPVKPGTTRIRLWGISAPEMKELDGWYARAFLDETLDNGGNAVFCSIVDTDDDHLVGVCYINTATGTGNPPDFRDVGGLMLSTGWASVNRLYAYSRAARLRILATFYDAHELSAREERRGFWSRMP